MYMLGQGHEHEGPGTSMVQFDHEAMSASRGGLGCAACGGNCGTCGKGMGLFDTGMDFTGWSWPEWGIAGLGVYTLLSTIFTTGRAVRKVRALPGERRKRRAASLRAEANELTKKKK